MPATDSSARLALAGYANCVISVVLTTRSVRLIRMQMSISQVARGGRTGAERARAMMRRCVWADWRDRRRPPLWAFAAKYIFVLYFVGGGIRARDRSPILIASGQLLHECKHCLIVLKFVIYKMLQL